MDREIRRRPTLYVVATPLGNLEDFSPRAVRLLGEVSTIYAEDTRRSLILLQHFGIRKPLVSLHEHNEHARSAAVLAKLEAGHHVALLSDAGTPAVSDPGADLVAQVAAAGFTVCPLPGASALTAALSVAGFSASEAGTLFMGFLPARGAARRDAVARVAQHAGAVVLFEAPHRIFATLHELSALEPARRACLARELSKLHEEVRHASLAELSTWAKSGVRGEVTLVLAPREEQEREAAVDMACVDDMLRRCLDAGLSARDAAAAAAIFTGRPRREMYERTQHLKGGRG